MIINPHKQVRNSITIRRKSFLNMKVKQVLVNLVQSMECQNQQFAPYSKTKMN